MTVLADYQVLAGGQIFGPGTDVQLISIDGLRALPGLRTGDLPRPLLDGNFPGLNLLDVRPVVFTFQTTVNNDATATEAAVSRCMSAFPNIPDLTGYAATATQYALDLISGNDRPVAVVQVKLPNRAVPLLVFGRPTAADLPVDTDYQYGRTTITVQWTAFDGALYDFNVVDGICGLPSSTAGLTFPLSFPVVFGTSSGGSIELDNGGNYRTWPAYVVAGPCVRPTITDQSTGASMTFDITLGVGDGLYIDTQAGTVLLNRTADRTGTLAAGSSFFPLEPGQHSIGFSTADSVAPAAQLTAAAFPAYSTV